jgi:hypothetical protein
LAFHSAQRAAFIDKRVFEPKAVSPAHAGTYNQ